MNPAKVSKNKNKALILIGIGLFIALFSILILIRGGNNGGSNKPESYESYKGFGFITLIPKDYELDSSVGVTKFIQKGNNEDTSQDTKEESFTIEKFAKSANITLQNVAKSARLDSRGKTIKGITTEQKEDGDKKYVTSFKEQTKESLAVKKVYVFGPSNIWLLTFTAESKSKLLDSSDTIINGFQPDKYPFE